MYMLAPLWRAAEARSWSAVRRSSRVAAWALTAGWAGFVAASIAYTPDMAQAKDLACSDASPCEPQLVLPLFLTLLLAGTVWLHIAPELALPALPAAAVIEVTQDTALPYYPAWFVPALALVTVLTIGYGVAVLRGRAVQRRLAVAASNGVLHSWPGPQPGRPWTNRWVAGVVVAAAGAVLALGYGQIQAGRYDERARAARQVTGTVVGHHEDDLVVRVRLPDGTEVDLDTLDATGYPLDSRVRVLVDGDWHALAVEPYDPFLPHFCGYLLLATAVTCAGLEWRLRRGLRMLRQPHPVLGVLLGLDEKGRTVVWPADAALTDHPLFMVDAEPFDPGDGIGPDGGIGPDDAGEADGDADEAEDERDPGVLHGPAHDGGVVAIEVRPAGEEPLLLLPVRLIRPARF